MSDQTKASLRDTAPVRDPEAIEDMLNSLVPSLFTKQDDGAFRCLKTGVVFLAADVFVQAVRIPGRASANYGIFATPTSGALVMLSSFIIAPGLVTKDSVAKRGA